MQDRFGDQRAVERDASNDSTGEEPLTEAAQERGEEIDWDERDERAADAARNKLRESNPEFFGNGLKSLDNQPL